MNLYKVLYVYIVYTYKTVNTKHRDSYLIQINNLGLHIIWILIICFVKQLYVLDYVQL